MDEIAELERRITSALVRIGQGLDSFGAASAAAKAAEGPVATLADGVAEEEIARLNEALDEEKMLTAQLQERLRSVRSRDTAEQQAIRAEAERTTKLLDVQGLELRRLKKNVGALVEQLRLMTEAQAQGHTDAHLINKAMLAELEALRALRAADSAEMDEIIAALDPLISDPQQEPQNA